MRRFVPTTTATATRTCSRQSQLLVQDLAHNGRLSLSQSDMKYPKIRIRCFSSLAPQDSTSVARTSRDGVVGAPIRIRRFSSLAPQDSTPVVHASKDGVVGAPIDFSHQSEVQGQESQIVTIKLYPGQVLRAESGAMMYMTRGVEMNTTAGGGLSDGFKRMLTGQNFFISDYTYTGPEGTTGQVALGTDFPSKILQLNVNEYGGKLVCQKSALLCASHTIDIDMEFTKSFSGGFFGGEGFVLQKLTGEGDVFLKAGGTLIRRELEPGEELRISSGCLVGFSAGVDYDVQMVQGFKNVFAGGEGLFMTTLTGPGVVWLQGQPPQRMISEIARRVPSGGRIGVGVPIGGGSGGDEGGSDESI